MVEKVKALLQGRSENHLAPFFWQHGEDGVATTLERHCYDLTKDDPRMKLRGLAAPTCGSGITGRVRVLLEHEQEETAL